MGQGFGTPATRQPVVLPALRGAPYQEITAADLLSLAPFKDPNGINNANIIVAAGGLVTVDLSEDAAVATRVVAQTASWRMNHLPGWRGDGSQAYAFRFTGIANHSGAAGDPGLGAVLMDRGGDTTLAADILAVSLENDRSLTRSKGVIELGGALDGAGGSDIDTVVEGFLFPGGPTGDASTSGAHEGTHGMAMMWNSLPGGSPVFKGTWSSASPESELQDGYFPCLIAGWGTLGANTGTLQVKVEWALVELLVPGAFLTP